MARLRKVLRQHTRRARRVEGFVRRIVVGGLALVTGLWILALFEFLTAVWILGVLLVGVGIGGLGSGIWSEIEY
jgi:hypothetical protein